MVYHSFRLDNGLRIIHHPTPGKGQVFVHMAYQVGSLNELPTQKGIAHLFEHMMFTGSQNIAHHHEEIEKIGGTCNAFTSFDTTRYFTSAPKEYLETIFWIESDRMFFPKMTEEKMETQKKIISEERKQVLLTPPYGDLLIHLLPLAYKSNTPFSWHIIGDNELTSITLDDLKNFGEKFYRPDNAVLVVSGDLPYKKIKRLAQKWFSEKGNSTQKKILPSLQRKKNNFSKIKKIIKRVPSRMLTQAYYMPKIADPSCLVLQILIDFLARGETGFLHQELVKKLKWVKKIQVIPLNTLYGGLLLFQYYLVSNLQPHLLEKKVEELLAYIADIGIQEELLKNLKNRIKNEWNSLKSTPEQFSHHMIYGHFIGDLNFFDKQIQNHLEPIDIVAIKKTMLHLFRKENSVSLAYMSL